MPTKPTVANVANPFTAMAVAPPTTALPLSATTVTTELLSEILVLPNES
jgi:hypothetical protein